MTFTELEEKVIAMADQLANQVNDSDRVIADCDEIVKRIAAGSESIGQIIKTLDQLRKKTAEAREAADQQSQEATHKINELPERSKGAMENARDEYNQSKEQLERARQWYEEAQSDLAAMKADLESELEKLTSQVEDLEHELEQRTERTIEATQEFRTASETALAGIAKRHEDASQNYEDLAAEAEQQIAGLMQQFEQVSTDCTSRLQDLESHVRKSSSESGAALDKRFASETLSQIAVMAHDLSEAVSAVQKTVESPKDDISRSLESFLDPVETVLDYAEEVYPVVDVARDLVL